MRHALEAFGFKECGTFKSEEGATYIAYDWFKGIGSTDDASPSTIRPHYWRIIMPDPMSKL